MAYQSFRPAPLPPVLDMEEEMIQTLVQAAKALVVLNTLSSNIPNMNLFVSMYVRKEALSLLHDRSMAVIDGMGRAAKTAKALFAYLEQNPIIDIGKTAEALKLSFSIVSGAVKRLEEKGILVQTNNVGRNRVFAYQEYLDILRKDT